MEIITATVEGVTLGESDIPTNHRKLMSCMRWGPHSTAEDSTAEDSAAELYLPSTLQRSFSQNADYVAPE